MEPITLMHARRRLMGTEPSMAPYSSNKTGQNSHLRESNFDTNMVIILAALLCALVFALGLNTILRCAVRCSRWFSMETPEQEAARLAATGLKKKDLRQIPVTVFGSSSASSMEAEVPITECPICLEEFVKGDKVRVLPKCNHGFHVKCIDRWLLSHSSCPNCRLSLLECHKGSCASSVPPPQHEQQEDETSRTGQQSAEQAGVVVVVDERGR